MLASMSLSAVNLIAGSQSSSANGSSTKAMGRPLIISLYIEANSILQEGKILSICVLITNLCEQIARSYFSNRTPDELSHERFARSHFSPGFWTYPETICLGVFALKSNVYSPSAKNSDAAESKATLTLSFRPAACSTSSGFRMCLNSSRLLPSIVETLRDKTDPFEQWRYHLHYVAKLIPIPNTLYMALADETDFTWIAFSIKSRASLPLCTGGAKPPSSPTFTALTPKQSLMITLSLWYTSVAQRIPSEKLSAPVGRMRNSCCASSFPACTPPFITLKAGVGKTCSAIFVMSTHLNIHMQWVWPTCPMRSARRKKSVRS